MSRKLLTAAMAVAAVVAMAVPAAASTVGNTAKTAGDTFERIEGTLGVGEAIRSVGGLLGGG
jgi:hypothetical protein